MSNAINIPDNNGDTPLLVAVRNRNVAIVEVLLRAGADVRHHNNAGESALSLARGHPELETMIGVRFCTAAVSGAAGSPEAPSYSPETSREASPEPSREASPEPSPESSRAASPDPDATFLFLQKFAWNEVARHTDSPESSPEGSPEPPSKRQRQAPPTSP